MAKVIGTREDHGLQSIMNNIDIKMNLSLKFSTLGRPSRQSAPRLPVLPEEVESFLKYAVIATARKKTYVQARFEQSSPKQTLLIDRIELHISSCSCLQTINH